MGDRGNPSACSRSRSRRCCKPAFRAPIVSAGGTGSFEITARQPALTEIQAGGGIFMDLMYREQCGVRSLEYALTILAKRYEPPRLPTGPSSTPGEKR